MLLRAVCRIQRKGLGMMWLKWGLIEAELRKRMWGGGRGFEALWLSLCLSRIRCVDGWFGGDRALR